MPAHRPARLSYRRAQERFAEATGGWTLHQLRHSALTHLAEANVGLPLLIAESRHTSLRSLQKYARPGVDAVARLTAEHDPARRRRWAQRRGQGRSCGGPVGPAGSGGVGEGVR